jgi:S1-C subfamily serine protease
MATRAVRPFFRITVAYQPGDQVTLEVVRGTQKLQFKVTLGESKTGT